MARSLDLWKHDRPMRSIKKADKLVNLSALNQLILLFSDEQCLFYGRVLPFSARPNLFDGRLNLFCACPHPFDDRLHLFYGRPRPFYTRPHGDEGKKAGDAG